MKDKLIIAYKALEIIAKGNVYIRLGTWAQEIAIEALREIDPHKDWISTSGGGQVCGHCGARKGESPFNCPPFSDSPDPITKS